MIENSFGNKIEILLVNDHPGNICLTKNKIIILPQHDIKEKPDAEKNF